MLGLRPLRSGYGQVAASNSNGLREVGYGCQQYFWWELGVAAGTKCRDRNTDKREGESCLLDLPFSFSPVQDLTRSQLAKESGKCILQNLCSSITKHSTEFDLELEDNS